MYKYTSTKEYSHLGPVAYRQWRADSHCNLIHGYALTFKFEFSTNELDVRNWVADYGGLRPLKDRLEEWFDHTLLVAEDDPHKDDLLNLQKLGLAKCTVVEKTGCEGLADYLYRYLNDPDSGFLKYLGLAPRCWCTRVEVRETPSNMAFVHGTPDTWVRDAVI